MYFELCTNDHEVLGLTGYYYKMNQKDLHEVLTYFNRALAIQEDPWYYREKVETLVALSMKAEALQTIDTAIRFLKKSKRPEWKDVENNFEEMKKKL